MTEIVYLATQIQMTEQIEQALTDFEGGNNEALKVTGIFFSSLYIKYKICFFLKVSYGKCPKILNAKASDKMTYADSADPDQTAPSGLHC